MVGVSDLNPFTKFNIGMGTIGNGLILFAIAIVILGLIGWLIYYKYSKAQYNKRIPLYRSINGINYLQNEYVAKNVPISKAGDSLWYVKGIKKYLSPATKTSALNTYPHEEREDGEWINFEIETVNEKQKKAGVKFIQQDMRTQRIATGQILEQRLINKGFWEKYKDIIVHLIFYLVTMVCMVVIFWQWGNITQQISGLVGKLDEIIRGLDRLQCVGVRDTGIVPALLPLMFWRKR